MRWPRWAGTSAKPLGEDRRASVQTPAAATLAKPGSGRTFRRALLGELVEARDLGVTRGPMLPASDMIVPPLAFGDRALDRPGLDFLGSSPLPDGARIALYPLDVYRLPAATVWGAPGLVTIGDRFVHESVQHLWPPFIGAELAGDTLTVWDHGSARSWARLPEAIHVLCGNADNYYHFQADMMARWLFRPVADILAPGTVLLPSFERPFQTETVALLAGRNTARHHLGLMDAVEVEALTFVSNVNGLGQAPYPEMRLAFDRMSGLVPDGAPTPSRVYLSRRDSPQRRLANETELESVAAEAGFSVVALDGLSVADQIRLFRGATHIVAPHGAGLTNVMFAVPGRCRLLELHMDEYVNWCFRRLCGVAGVAYGCLVGTSRRETPHTHRNTWTLPSDMLRTALRDPGFLLR